MTQTIRRHTALPGGTNEAPRAPKRDSFFDNAKLLAIVLVVVAHAWEPLRAGSRAVTAAYIVVYTFHMPVMILISGYFSRSFDTRTDRLQRLITGIAVPYLVFETAYSLFNRYAGGHPNHPISLLDPWYLTWFLTALFVWRLTAPLWRVVRWPIPLALAVAALAGTTNFGKDLDMGRVLQFLPFFVVGLCLEGKHFRMVRQRRVRLFALPLFAATAVFAYWAAPRMNLEWLFHRDTAADLGASNLKYVAITLILFVCSLLLSAAFLAWVPGRRMWITELGQRTLYVYLLQGFLLKGAQWTHLYDHHFWHTPVGEVGVTIIGIGVGLALATPLVGKIFRPVMEPKMAWAFRRPARSN